MFRTVKLFTNFTNYVADNADYRVLNYQVYIHYNYMNDVAVMPT